MAHNWEDHDNARTAAAVGEIQASENLRFFIRGLLAVCGANTTPEGGNALETSRAIGRHSIGTDIITTLISVSPSLYAELMLEDIREQNERNKDNVEIS